MESWTAGGVVVNRELLKGKALSYCGPRCPCLHLWTQTLERVVDTNSQTRFLCRVCELRAETAFTGLIRVFQPSATSSSSSGGTRKCPLGKRMLEFPAEPAETMMGRVLPLRLKQEITPQHLSKLPQSIFTSPASSPSLP